MRDLRRDRLQLAEPGTCYIAAAIVGAVGSVVGGVAKASGAGKAAKTQADMYNTTRGDLMPYNTGGQADFSEYNALQPFKFDPTMDQLEQTPGYQFALTQGLKGVQNSATQRGLGVSGAAQKGAANFATGLASQTFQQQYTNALNSYQTNANKLFQGAQLGEAAAAQTGTIGQKTAENQGAAQINQGNAIGSGIQGATGIFANYLMGP